MTHHVSARPFGDWTRPRVGPLLEIADPNRLSPRPLRGDPPGSDRQASRLRHRARLAHLGSHVSLPVRDPRAQLRPEVARVPARRVRSGHAPAARSDLESAGRRVVSGVRMVVSDGSLQCRWVVRHVAARPVRPGRRNRRVRPARRIWLGPRDLVVEGTAGVHRPRHAPFVQARPAPERLRPKAQAPAIDSVQVERALLITRRLDGACKDLSSLPNMTCRAGDMAADASSTGNPGESGSRLAGVCGILLGILVIATFAASYNFPAGPSQADATLAQFSSLRNAFLAGDIFIGLAAVFAIPYFVGLRDAFDGKDRLLVGSATIMGLVGFVVTAVVFIGEAITLDVLSGPYATGGVSTEAGRLVAQAVIGFGTVEVFGFLVFAAGFAVYGFATIRGKPFPRWLGYVGILGVILILVWVFATSGLMWRSRAPSAAR